MKRRRIALQNARKCKGMSQKEIAKLLGIALRTYQNYEYCERGLSLEMAEKIANLLDISLDELSARNITTKNEITEIA